MNYNEIGKFIWDVIVFYGCFNLIFYYIPYTLRRGWGDAENKTKKVCDTCFRDIEKWNEALKKADLVK